MIDRRLFITAALMPGFAPRLAFAAASTQRRFVFVIQRGGADGMHILAPVGDPAYAAQRGALAEEFAAVPRLDAMFAMHPALVQVRALYRAKQVLFAHAVASPYRDRSHFDAQNVLESGGAAAYRVKDGWLNRMLGLLPQGEARAIALATAIPLAMRGSNRVGSYAPAALPDATADLLQQVSRLYEGDAQLHGLWNEAMRTRALTGDLDRNTTQNAAATGALAARLLVPEDGARVMMVETGGWDTHLQQRGRLAGKLKELDALIGALKSGLGPVWAETLVVVATEFGRTVKVNGTYGTDHGTGTVAMLMGGTVDGGRVIADWPGLTDAQLHEGRDLRPTLGLDTVIGSAVARHYDLAPGRTMTTLFPDTKEARFLPDLIRA